MQNKFTLILDMKDYIRTHIKMGFDDLNQIIEDTVLAFEDGIIDPNWLEEKARILTRGLSITNDLEQAKWEYPTDCDKLDDAFAELDRDGIIARHDWQCCQTCGRDTIRSEMEAAQDFKWVAGYVFYHRQDTESAVRSNYLYLAFGSFDHTEEESEAVGNIIVNVLIQHGLQTEWDGNAWSRICINNINWQRRRLPHAFLNVEIP